MELKYKKQFEIDFDDRASYYNLGAESYLPNYVVEFLEKEVLNPIKTEKKYTKGGLELIVVG